MHCKLQHPVGQPPRLTEARRWALELEASALGAEIEMLGQELFSQPMRIELLGCAAGQCAAGIEAAAGLCRTA